MKVFSFVKSSLLFALSDANVCQDLCAVVDSCISSKKAQNSYCKFWQNPPVCFGLYFTDATYTKVCYKPSDPGCPEKYPVICHEH